MNMSRSVPVYTKSRGHIGYYDLDTKELLITDDQDLVISEPIKMYFVNVDKDCKVTIVDEKIEK